MDFEHRQTKIKAFFAGVTEHTFHVELGVADTQLVDYLTDMLTRFLRMEVLYRIRDLRGVPLAEVAAMLMEAEERIGEAKREVHRHIGDFVLFWAGCYPETLKAMRLPNSRDSLIDYCAQGRRSYAIASTIPALPKDNVPGPVLERLAQHFDLCVYGLGEVRREWERRDDEEPPRPFLIN